MIAEGALDGRGFQFVAQRSGGAVGVDVADLLRREAGVAEGVAHHAVATFASGRRLGDVVGIGAHAVADNFGDDRRAALPGEFQLFQNQNPRAFADDEAVAILVPGTAGAMGIVVASGERAHGAEIRRRPWA